MATPFTNPVEFLNKFLIFVIPVSLVKKASRPVLVFIIESSKQLSRLVTNGKYSELTSLILVKSLFLNRLEKSVSA